MIRLTPLFKWSGGKTDEIKEFIDLIPKNIEIYVEPFVGSGALFFYLNPQKAVINDIHQELIAFYKEIKKGNGNLIYKFMSLFLNDEFTYYKIRNEFELKDETDIACRFFYLRKTCYRGMIRYSNGKFNIPFGRYKTINCENLLNEEYTKLLRRTDIFNTDFQEIFNKYGSNPNNFIFIDPPYDSKFSNYWSSFSNEDHKRLLNCFIKAKSKCLMIIGKTKFIEELYKGYIHSSYQKKYKFRIHSGRVGNEINTTHLIIKNF